MRPKRCLVSGCCLEIMRIFFWKMCDTKECVELKFDISQFKSPFGKCAMQKNALKSKMSIRKNEMSIFFKLGSYLENVAMK